MDADPLDEILGYLGLGPKPPPNRIAAVSRPPDPADGGQPAAEGERLLAEAGPATLWLVGNEGAEWIELRGPFTTLRATRPKAKLLVDVRQDLEHWADGGSPEVKARDLLIRPARRFGAHVLEVTYRTWKPVRLTRDQAKALLRVIDHLKDFARNANR